MGDAGSILAVDDQVLALVDLQQSLNSAGYEVDIALDASAAMEVARERHPDLILVDLRLGEEDGVALIQDLHEICPSSVYVVMSAYADTESAIRAMQAGANDFLIKPYTPHDLMLVVNRSFQSLALIREKERAEEALIGRNAELSAMNSRLRQMVTAVTSPELMQPGRDPAAWMLEEFARAMGAEGGSLYLVNGDRLERRHAVGSEHSEEWVKLPPEPGSVTAQIFSTVKPVVIDAIDEEPELHASGWSGYQHGALMSFPLVSRGGVVEGVVHLHNSTAPGLLSHDLDLGTIFASLILEMIRNYQANEEIRARERRFRALIEHSTDLITLLDGDGEIAYDSPSIASILFQRPDDRVGTQLSDHIHPDDRDHFRSWVFSTPDSDKSEFSVARTANLYGHWRYMEYERSFRLDDPAVQGIVLNARDVTERLTAEESLRESEARYRNLFENSPSISFVCRPDNTVIEANQTSRDLLGFSPDQLSGMGFHELVHPADRDMVGDRWSIVLAGERPEGTEFTLVGADGREHRVYARPDSQQLVTRNDELVAVRSELVDVTELRALQARERQQREELYQAAKLVSLGTLLSGVAHEINNPNNFIRMSIDNLRDFWVDASRVLDRLADGGEQITLGGIDYQRAREMVTKMVSSITGGSERIERLVTDLKDFARKGDSQLHSIVDVSEAVRSAVTIVAATVRKCTARFEIIDVDHPVTVNANAQQIEQVVMNLVTNACNALESRDQGITLQIRHRLDDPFVDISVTDEGAGIPREMIQQITDPFFTTRRGEGGTGLGLAVSHRIASDHGGTLEFDSTLGEGTTAVLRLPCVDGAAGAQVSKEARNG